MLTLPIELHEEIFKKLHVKDRAMLRCVLPPRSSSRPPIQDEKKLYVIARVVKKKKLPQLSEKIKVFLSSYDITDPTIVEIAQTFPELHNSPPQTQTVTEKILNNNFVYDDIKNIDKETIMNDYDFRRAFYQSSIDSFKILITNPNIKEILFDNRNIFIFNLLNYVNEPLLKYILFEPFDHVSDDDKIIMRQYIADNVASYSTLYLHKQKRTLLLKYFQLPPNVLETLWIKSIENLEMDAAEDIENHINT